MNEDEMTQRVNRTRDNDGRSAAGLKLRKCVAYHHSSSEGRDERLQYPRGGGPRTRRTSSWACWRLLGSVLIMQLASLQIGVEYH